MGGAVKAKAQGEGPEAADQLRGIGQSKACVAAYRLAGYTVTTTDIALGNVTATLVPPKSRRTLCQEKAENSCNHSAVIAMIKQSIPVGTPAFNNLCSNGSIQVTFDSTVLGVNNEKTKDGKCMASVACTKSPVVCTCPSGWAGNTGPGANTTDGRCKKLACQPNQVMPAPANGTVIGTAPPATGTSSTSWGFSWGNAFYAWGTAANGGAPTCTGGQWTGYQ